MSEIEEIELEPITTGQVAKKWGLYLGLVFIVYGLIQQLAGLAANDTVGYLAYIILIAGIVLAHREYKKEGNGYMSYKQGFSIGAVVTVISSIMSIAFTYVYIKFVDDSMIDMIKDKQLEELEASDMSDAQIEQAMEFTAGFMTPEVMMALALFFGILIGIVISLVIAAITKNTDPSEEI